MFGGLKTKRKQQEPEETPFYLPDMVLITTSYGLYIEQYGPNIRKIAGAVEQDNINKHLRFLNNKPVFSFKQGENDSMLPFDMPSAAQIKISSIKLYAMVVTYPRTIARMIRRRHRNDRDNLVKGMKSIWVIALIFVVLLIILMLGVSIVGAGDGGGSDPETATDTNQPAYTIEYEEDANGKPSPKLEKGQGLTVPIDTEAKTSTNTDLPRAVKSDDNIARGVLIDAE